MLNALSRASLKHLKVFVKIIATITFLIAGYLLDIEGTLRKYF